MSFVTTILFWGPQQTRGWSEDTAQRYISVAQAFGKYDNLSDLSIPGEALRLTLRAGLSPFDQAVEQFQNFAAKIHGRIHVGAIQCAAGDEKFETGFFPFSNRNQLPHSIEVAVTLRIVEEKECFASRSD